MKGDRNECGKCGAVWESRIDGEPVQCPRCKSLRWREEIGEVRRAPVVGKPKRAMKREAAPVIKEEISEKKTSRGRQVDVKVGPRPDTGRKKSKQGKVIEAETSRVEARKEQPSPSEFESPRLHQNSTLEEGVPEKIDWLEEETRDVDDSGEGVSGRGGGVRGVEVLGVTSPEEAPGNSVPVQPVRAGVERASAPVVTGRRAVTEGEVDPDGTIFLDRLCQEMGADYKGALQRARMNKRGSKLKFDEASGRYTVGPEFEEMMKAAKENPEWT